MEKEYEQVNKRGYKMLDRTWKRVGHGKEREVGGERREITRREEIGEVLTYLDGM